MDKILELFFKNPRKEYHLREIARAVNVSPTTVSKKLDVFVKDELLSRRKSRNHILFAAAESSSFMRKKTIYNEEKIEKSGLVDYLNDEYNHPGAIVLFGSFARGEDIEKSDIDIAIITPLKKEVGLMTFEKKLGKSIQLFRFSKSEIEKMKTNNKELLNNLINGTVISGFLEVFV